MYTTSELLDPRFFWSQIPLVSKLYAAVLCAVAIYTLISSSRMMLRLNLLEQQHAAGTPQAISRIFNLLRKKSHNLQQLILFTALLFAIVFFIQIPWAFSSNVNSKTPAFIYVFQYLSTYFAFASDVCFLLLFIHSAQWFVSARILSAEIRLTLPR